MRVHDPLTRILTWNVPKRRPWRGCGTPPFARGQFLTAGGVAYVGKADAVDQDSLVRIARAYVGPKGNH